MKWNFTYTKRSTRFYTGVKAIVKSHNSTSLTTFQIENVVIVSDLKICNFSFSNQKKRHSVEILAFFSWSLSLLLLTLLYIISSVWWSHVYVKLRVTTKICVFAEVYHYYHYYQYSNWIARSSKVISPFVGGSCLKPPLLSNFSLPNNND